MTKMLMLLIMEDSSSRSEMDQNSDSRAVVRAKEAPKAIKEEKVVRNHVVTVHKCPAYGKDCFQCKKKGHSVPTADPAGTTNCVLIHPQEDLDVYMKWSKMTMVMIEHSP